MSGHDHHGFAHVASPKLLLTTFFVLIALTLLTVLTAGTPLVGPFGAVIAMGIATVKAALVALFFMHMYGDKPFNVIAFLSSFLFASLFIGLTLLDSSHYQNEIDAFPRTPPVVTPK